MAKRKKEETIVIKSPVQELIKRRRGQMLVHSCIYYEMDDSVISDDQWQAWAEELHKLQTKHPKYCKLNFFDHEFADWDGTTGSHLPHRHPWVYNKAKYILNISKG